MSTAVGYCGECGFIVDLNAWGYLITHRACKGSLTKPTEPPPAEDDRFAFRSDPVERFCPHCGRRVVINTIGALHRSGWRYSYHRMPGSKLEKLTDPHLVDCPQSGQLVTPRRPGNENTVEVRFNADPFAAS